MKPFQLLILILLVCLLPMPASAGEFEALFAGQQTVDGENTIAVTFSDPVDGRQNLSAFLGIRTEENEPVKGAWVLTEDSQVAYFSGIEPDTAYKIRVMPGLKSETGHSLGKEYTYKIRTREADPMISFGSTGFVLASELTSGLPVNSLNIPQADIDFFRVKPGKTAKFLDTFRSYNRIGCYDSKDLNRLADLVYTGRWQFDIKKNLRTQVNLPITHIQELKPCGIYFAVLRGAGHYEYEHSTAWFTISDLGLHARVYSQSLVFHAQSLKTADPLATVTVKGVDEKGNRLFSGTTDDQGRLAIKGRFDGLSLVTAFRGDHITLLPMNVPALDLSEFAMGKDAFRPVELFVYGPRNIYRPGETVVMDGILRDQDGGPTLAVPIKAKVIQPDGKMIREFTWKPGAGNHFFTRFSLPGNALTGNWKVEFSNGTGELSPYLFLVSEFLPERIKLELEDSQDKILSPKSDFNIKLQGDFLYGAPAAGTEADAMIHVKPARELFKDQWPDVEFGSLKDLINTSYSTDQITLDGQGQGTISVEKEWADVTSPHWVTANVSLYDSGGRPVVRNISRQIWPGDMLTGIRNLTPLKDEAHRVPYDSTAEFEVILVDKQGTLQPAKGLKATVIREHREYYWEYKNEDWHWGYTSQHYPVDRFSFDIDQDSRGKVSFPVQWGGYRLEILNPATGLTTTYAVRAGWDPDPEAREGNNRPDRVDLILDKPAYLPGDTAKVTVKPPRGGKGWLFVDGDQNLLTLPIEIPEQGKTVEFTVDPSWNRHDLYVSALIIRQAEPDAGDKADKLPKRSLGLIPLPLDRSSRQLVVDIKAPDKIEPNQTVEVTVNLGNTNGEKALVTLAAVDVGILNLTQFETPCAFDYFFRTRTYETELFDIYQKLIEPNDGAYGRHRFGGDAPSLTRGGDRPSTDVQIVALHCQAMETDDRGNARFTLDLPDFNGTLRLMAVAHTANGFGSGDKEMILASPLVVQATMPRFLSTGDKAFLMLDLHNLTDTAQHLTLNAQIFGPVSFDGETMSQTIALEPSGKSVRQLPMTAGTQSGRANITCTIKGIQHQGKTRDLTKKWFIETRSPYPPLTQRWARQLAPGETLALADADLEALVSETIGVKACLDAQPPINLSDHIASLMAYPYGCLEQTVSGLFAHVLLSGEQFDRLGVATSGPEETTKKINLGIQGLMEKQKSTGGFGLWDSNSHEEAWLTAYTAHFLINAADAGFQVPDTVLEDAVKRLATYVRKPRRIPTPSWVDRNAFRAQVCAYSAFVLARVQALGLGDARTVLAYAQKYGGTPLALVQAGAALSLAGDFPGAAKAFDLALKTDRDTRNYHGDYGSEVRDRAAAYYYIATWSPQYEDKGSFLIELNTAIQDRQWLSTQERNALVMAGAARLNATGTPWQAGVTVSGKSETRSGDQPGQVIFTRGTAAKGFAVENKGSDNLYVDLVLTGYPRTAPAPSASVVCISRRFLDPRGKPMDITRVRSGDRIIVELSVKTDKRLPHALVVDMVPAGIELEDPHVSGAFIIDGIDVDGELIEDWHHQYHRFHDEYRDDRFVAAMDLKPGQARRIFYGARVVSPGLFKVPPSLVEDMYRPYIRSVGNTVDEMEVVKRQDTGNKKQDVEDTAPENGAAEKTGGADS